MRKSLIIILLSIFYYDLAAQLVVKPIPKHLSADNISGARINKQQAAVDTIALPFWDDFSTSSPDPNENFWRFGADVFINGTMGIAPPTLNVATFDGIDATGVPFNIDSDIVGPTDSLVSQYIDLTLVPETKRNSVFMSFFWQMKGRGEQPDPDDSLRLQFLNAENQWITQWSLTGAEQNLSDEFQQHYIQITDEQFYHEGFSMKFQSFGKTTGPFDAWHIDYVYVNQDRTNVNEGIFDHSIASEPVSLFNTYTSVPYSQFFAFPDTLLKPLTFDVATQDTTVAQAVLVFYTVTDIANGNVLLEDLTENTITPLNIPPDNKKRDVVTTQVNLTHADFDPDLDSMDIQIELSYQSDDGFLITSINPPDTSFLVDPAYNFRVNDTLRQQISIRDVFAYDDGVAEFAAGLNQKNGQLVVQYILAEQDTITHLDIYFPQIKPVANGQVIELLVMRDLSGDVGSILAKQPTTAQYTDNINEFIRYQFEEPLVVSDTIYVGFEQNTSDFVPVGLDKNNPQGSRIFFKTGDEWEKNLKVDGSLMIRPVFRAVETVVVNNVSPEINEIILYPNPANEFVRIAGNYDKVELYTIYGQKLDISIINDQFDTHSLPNGIYLVKSYLNNRTQTNKLIINH